jgi:hypothetical protein
MLRRLKFYLVRRRCRIVRALRRRRLLADRRRDSFVIIVGIGGRLGVGSVVRGFVGWSVRKLMRLRGV